jgi:hypothetical protein
MRKVTWVAISALGALLSLPALAEITPTVTAQKPISNNLPQNPVPAGVLSPGLLEVLPSGNYQYIVSFNHFGPPTPPPTGAGYPIGSCISTSMVVQLTHTGDHVTFAHNFSGTLDAQGNIAISNGNPKVNIGGHLVGKDEITGSGIYPCSGGGATHAVEFDLKLVP